MEGVSFCILLRFGKMFKTEKLEIFTGRARFFVKNSKFLGCDIHGLGVEHNID
jgi:hypothetical protein